MMPMLMRLKIRPRNKRGVSLWLPVILAWILLWVLMILVFPLMLLAALITWRRGPGIMLLLIYPLLFSVLWHLTGLHIDVQDADNDVLISFL